MINLNLREILKFPRNFYEAKIGRERERGRFFGILQQIFPVNLEVATSNFCHWMKASF